MSSSAMTSPKANSLTTCPSTKTSRRTCLPRVRDGSRNKHGSSDPSVDILSALNAAS